MVIILTIIFTIGLVKAYSEYSYDDSYKSWQSDQIDTENNVN
jgi:hypothetical protein